MTFIAALIAVLVAGYLLGRNSEFVNSKLGFLIKILRFFWDRICSWMRENPRVVSAFFAGVFVGLLMSGSFSGLLGKFVFLGFAVFCLSVFFPSLVPGMIGFASGCAARVKNYFF